MPALLWLQFSDGPHSELLATRFQMGETHPVHSCVRGKSAGAFHGHGTFQWSNAVQAMSLLFIRAKLLELAHQDAGKSPLLQGRKQSAASSLDMSISAKTLWLSEMFGTDIRGNPHAPRIFSRSNTSLKRPGPVSIGLNPILIHISRIEIRINDQPMDIPRLSLLQRELSCEFQGCDTVSHFQPLSGFPAAA